MIKRIVDVVAFPLLFTLLAAAVFLVLPWFALVLRYVFSTLVEPYFLWVLG